MEDEQSSSNFNIIEYSSNLVKQTKQIDEKNFIFIGDNKSGKTTVFNLIFSNKKEKDTKYIQTCGINFNNATVSFSNLNRKILLNGYELGGNVENIQLIKNIVFENNISNTTFVLIIDLSQPEIMLNIINQTLKIIGESLSQNISSETLQMMAKSKEHKLRSKSDSNICEFVPWNLCIIGSKYDLFEKIDV